MSARCYKCGTTSESAEPENGWYNPYRVKQGNNHFLQTALCPDCCPRFSPFMWMRRHPANRFLNKLYANFFGYFWLPCPKCHRHRGGHEKEGKGTEVINGSSRMTCSNC